MYIITRQLLSLDLDEDQTDSWTDGMKLRLMVRQIDEWMDGQTKGQTDIQTNGQLEDRWMGRLRDEWTDEQTNWPTKGQIDQPKEDTQRQMD